MAAPAANVPVVNGAYARLVPREVTASNDRQAMRMPIHGQSETQAYSWLCLKKYFRSNALRRRSVHLNR